MRCELVRFGWDAIWLGGASTQSTQRAGEANRQRRTLDDSTQVQALFARCIAERMMLMMMMMLLREDWRWWATARWGRVQSTTTSLTTTCARASILLTSRDIARMLIVEHAYRCTLAPIPLGEEMQRLTLQRPRTRRPLPTADSAAATGCACP